MVPSSATLPIVIGTVYGVAVPEMNSPDTVKLTCVVCATGGAGVSAPATGTIGTTPAGRAGVVGAAAAGAGEAGAAAPGAVIPEGIGVSGAINVGAPV